MKFSSDDQKKLDLSIQMILDEYPDSIAIYVFGTFGTEYFRPDSDLDLAVYTTEKLEPVKLWDLAQKIASRMNHDVDLIDLASASTVFCHQIISTGYRIYCSQSKECDKFELLCNSMYLRFNEERKEILEEFKRPK